MTLQMQRRAGMARAQTEELEEQELGRKYEAGAIHGQELGRKSSEKKSLKDYPFRTPGSAEAALRMPMPEYPDNLPLRGDDLWSVIEDRRWCRKLKLYMGMRSVNELSEAGVRNELTFGDLHRALAQPQDLVEEWLEEVNWWRSVLRKRQRGGYLDDI